MLVHKVIGCGAYEAIVLTTGPMLGGIQSNVTNIVCLLSTSSKEVHAPVFLVTDGAQVLDGPGMR